MRKSYSGAAIQTTLTSAMLAGDTSFNVGATTNWPNTTTGPFVVTVDRGLSTEEKILCASYTSTVVTAESGGRGFDGTTAVGHSLNAPVVCSWDADSANQANLVVNSVGSVSASTSAVGDSPTAGTNVTAPAAADHKHGREPWLVGATSSSNPGDTANDGVDLSPSRADHVHGREAAYTPPTPPSCRVYRAAAYTDVNSSSTLCPFDTVQWDSNSAFSTSTHLYTAPLAGKYQVNAGWGRTTGLSNGQAMILFIYHNSGVWAAGSYDQWTANGPDLQSVVSDIVNCASGDTINVHYADYGGGGAQTFAANCYMSICWVSP